MLLLFTRAQDKVTENLREERFAEFKQLIASGSREAAVNLLIALSEEGHLPSQYEIGQLYLSGALFDRDPEKARKIFELGAAKNFAPSLYGLSFIYSQGHGVPVDTAKAIELLQQAADLNYAPAMNSLGLRFRDGIGVPHDLEKAADLIIRAARSGDIEA